jgi:putative FmdB family regulatory protein
LELDLYKGKGCAMPTYEYRCKRCGHRFEKFQSMKDQPVKLCPLCRGETERLISTGGGIIFKGSGFYSTDYRSESYKKRVKEEKESWLKNGKEKEKKAIEK